MTRTLRFVALAPISTLAVALLATQAFPHDQPTADTPCVIEPDEQQQQDRAETGESLSDTLDRCGSVLEPPGTGDQDLVEPAPPVGETPVIPPDQLPANP